MKHEEILLIARQIAGSRLFRNAQSVEQVFVLIMAGTEIGLSPLQSVANITIENSKMTLSAGVIAGLLQRSERYSFKVLENTNERCSLEFFDNGESSGVSTFTIDDAKLAGIDQKDTWKRYPKSLLFARALTSGMRTFAAGVIGQAIYTSEELEGPGASTETVAVQADSKPETTLQPKMKVERQLPEQNTMLELSTLSYSLALTNTERETLRNAAAGYNKVAAEKALKALHQRIAERVKAGVTEGQREHLELMMKGYGATSSQISEAMTILGTCQSFDFGNRFIANTKKELASPKRKTA